MNKPQFKTVIKSTSHIKYLKSLQAISKAFITFTLSTLVLLITDTKHLKSSSFQEPSPYLFGHSFSSLAEVICRKEPEIPARLEQETHRLASRTQEILRKDLEAGHHIFGGSTGNVSLKLKTLQLLHEHKIKQRKTTSTKTIRIIYYSKTN